MYIDQGITKAHFRKALTLLKGMRASTQSLDRLVEHKDYDLKVRHAAEECLRTYGEPLPTVTDRAACITHAIQVCVRHT
jgi:hypothetical protein